MKTKESKTTFIYWIQSNQISTNTLYIVVGIKNSFIQCNTAPLSMIDDIKASIYSISAGFISLTLTGTEILFCILICCFFSGGNSFWVS